jgi:uncharacterized repeat protein (TIGR03803 family)
MKKSMMKLFVFPVLVAGFGLMLCSPASAQTFKTLHSLDGASDGNWPNGDLVFSGGTLYGTTWGGGTSDYGTVFKLNTDGTGFTTLHRFTTQGSWP